jgi:transposase
MASYNTTKFKEITDTSEFWTGHEDVMVKDQTPEQMAAEVAEVEALNKEIDALDKQRVELDGKRDRKFTTLRELNARVRKAVVAAYGSDAPELRSLGLIPASERKPRTRKPRNPT